MNFDTKADGSGTSYADGASFSYRSSGSGKQDGVTLYAQWKVNTYTDTIAHWMGGLKNGEGNNGTAKNYFLLGATSWRQDFGTQLTYDATRQTKVPNGTLPRTSFKSPSFGTGWESYTMPKTFTLLGWSANASDTAADYSVTNAVNGDWILEKSPKTDLYAVWKINQYYVDVNVIIDGKVRNNSGAWDGKSLGSWGDRKIVTFDMYVNGSRVGTGVSDFWEKHDYGSKIELRDIRPAEGFELDPASPTSETVPDYDTQLNIRLNQTAYKITYDLAGGTFGSQAAPTTYHIGDAPVTIPTPTRDHHVFLGWTGSNGTTPQTSVTIPTGSTGDRSYSANWRSDRYTVRFDKNSADAKGSIADMACEWGKDLKAPDGSAYTRTGWHVTSWNTKADGRGRSSPSAPRPGTSRRATARLSPSTPSGRPTPTRSPTTATGPRQGPWHPPPPPTGPT
ncbi:InlB B-repeat-containing protein [Olsenella porci]|uniref:Bacterial repeat domain-containing protein n=1 Tax=Olsenella porci TaxID=2652279 RepID=A0A6N7XQ07_9ACTN|nr:InlB B-repeat-containing protein [Olsenella porci]MST72029.1 hypothetical protein [Olsenella porci]